MMPPSPDIVKVALNGVEQPKRIWLYCYRHDGDVCWSSDPNPEGVPDDELQAVEYVRADAIEALDPSGEAERLREALKQAVLDLHEAAGRFAIHTKLDLIACSELTREAASRADAALSGEP